MNLKFGTLCLFLVFMFLIAGCDYESNTNQQSSTNSKIKPLPLSLSEDNSYDTSSSISEWSRKAKTEKNKDYCYKISYDYDRSSCFQTVAIELKDETICWEIDIALDRRSNFEPGALMFTEQCVNLVKNSIAAEVRIDALRNELKDSNKVNYVVEECELHLTSRDHCYYTEAQTKKNDGYCDLMNTQEETIANCKNLVKYILLFDEIKANGTIDDCDKIPNVEWRANANVNYWCTYFFNNQ